MKAIVQDRYGPADVLELRDIDRPEVVGDDDVLVRVHAAGVDPGVWHLMTGLPYLIRIGFGLFAPRVRVRGTDLAGTVVAVGKNVIRFREGDEVFGACDGSFAEYALSREPRLAPRPTNLTLEQAAAVPTSAITALQGLRDHGKVRPGQRVLIVGASGGVGTFAVQVARDLGADVTGVCSTGKVDLVRSLGADRVIDYRCEDFTQTGSRWDVILDIGGNRPVGQLRRALTPKGTLVIVGGEGGGKWLGGTERQMGALLLTAFVSHDLRSFVATGRNGDLDVLGELIEAGKLTPVIDRTFSLSDAPEAVRYLEQGHARGKVVVTI